MRLLGMLPTPPGESSEPVGAFRRPLANSGAAPRFGKAGEDGPTQAQLDSAYMMGQLAAEEMIAPLREAMRKQRGGVSSKKGSRSRG